MTRKEALDIVEAAQASPRLNNWEHGFINSVSSRLGEGCDLTETQEAKLRQIENKIYAAG